MSDEDLTKLDGGEPASPARAKKGKKSLTNLQRAFVNEYLMEPGSNGTQAMLRANPRVTYGSARQMASEFLSRDEASPYAHVRAEIDRQLADLDRRAGITKERVRLELARLAFANMGRLARWNGDGVELIDSNELSDEETAAVAKITVTSNETTIDREGSTRTTVTRTVQVQMIDKNPSLNILAKSMGVVADDGAEIVRGFLVLPDGSSVEPC